MAYSLIARTAKRGGINSVTTNAIDTTGADLLVVTVASQAAGSMSDSKGNSYTLGKSQTLGHTTYLYYCQGGTVGTSHTFTYSATGGYISACVSAWSGSAASPLDQTNGSGAGAVTSLATGSITPTEDNCLVIASGGQNDATITNLSIDSGFTHTDAANGTTDFAGFLSLTCYGSYTGYKIQTTAAAVNPTWTYVVTVTHATALIVSFKAAAAGGATPKGVFGKALHGPLKRAVYP